MRRNKSEQGQALVEIAVALPMLIYLCIGGADVARGITQYIQVVNAANTGAQYGGLSPTKSQDTTTIQSVVTSNLSGVSSPTITVTTGDDGTGRSLNQVRVSVSTVFHPATPFVGVFAPNITISTSSTMRVNPDGT